MVHRALAGLVTSLILGCATVAPVPPGAAPPSHWSRGAADRIARDLGLTPLRLARPDVEREIRIWTLGGGYMIPDPMVRLREHRGRVSGQVFEAWPLAEGQAQVGVRDPRLHGLLSEDGWDQRTRALQCRRGRHARVCEWQPAATVDWTALLRALDALEIGRAPGAPGCSAGVDGFQLIVEIRSAGRYRQYRCWTPDDENRETARMRRIIDTIRNAPFAKASGD